MRPGGEAAAARSAAEREVPLSVSEVRLSLLASEGIEAWIRADDAGGELPNLDFAKGARVLVAEADADRARGVLNAAAEE